MSDYDRYVSDNESDFSVDDDIIGADEDVAKNESNMKKPEDFLPDNESDVESVFSEESVDNIDDVGEGENIDDAGEVGEGDIMVEPAEEEDEEAPVDLKSVSEFNREIIIVKPENRRTSNILSKYETTEIVSIRAVQISQFNNCMVDTVGLDDPIKMARKELAMRRCPLTLRRHVGDLRDKKTGEIRSYYELWDPNTMTMVVSFADVI